MQRRETGESQPIGALLNNLGTNYPAPPDEITGKVPEQALCTIDGVVRCRFDMFVRWPLASKRKTNPFTYRGDHFEKEDPAKMLWNLVRMFKNKYNEFLLVELYDNTKQKNDDARTILRYKNRNILVNRLQDYNEMLKDYPLPEWLKSKI